MTHELFFVFFCIPGTVCYVYLFFIKTRGLESFFFFVLLITTCLCGAYNLDKAINGYIDKTISKIETIKK